MSTNTLERLPNTVTACHAEIRKLRALVGGVDPSADALAATLAERDSLKATLGDRDKEVDELAATAAEFKAKVGELEQERDEIKETLAATEKEKDELDERVEELEKDHHPDALDAIDQFLFEVQRPVGQFKFDVLHGPATDRAILRLYDAAGLQP